MENGCNGGLLRASERKTQAPVSLADSRRKAVGFSLQRNEVLTRNLPKLLKN